MEVVVVDLPAGLPKDSILSLRAGAVRRQSVVEKIDRPFRFPGKLEECGSLKLELLRVVASGRATCVGSEKQYRMKLHDHSQVSDAAVVPGEISLLVRAAGGTGPGAAVAAVEGGDEVAPESAAKEREERKRSIKSTCEGYLEKNGLLQFMQIILQGLMKEQPEDPFAYIAEKSKQRGAEVKGELEDLRVHVQKLLATAADSGALAAILGEREKPQTDAAVDSLEDLKAQARKALLAVSSGAGMAAAPKSPEQASAASPSDLEDLKAQARTALLVAADERDRGPAAKPSLSVVETLRLQARSALLAASKNGGFAAAMASRPGTPSTAPPPIQGDSALESLRMQARELLLAQTRNGGFASALASRRPVPQGEAETSVVDEPADSQVEVETSGLDDRVGLETIPASPSRDPALTAALREIDDLAKDKVQLHNQVDQLQNLLSTVVGELAQLRKKVDLHDSQLLK